MVYEKLMDIEGESNTHMNFEIVVNVSSVIDELRINGTDEVSGRWMHHFSERFVIILCPKNF